MPTSIDDLTVTIQAEIAESQAALDQAKAALEQHDLSTVTTSLFGTAMHARRAACQSNEYRRSATRTVLTIVDDVEEGTC